MKMRMGAPLSQSVIFAEGAEVEVDGIRLKRLRGVWQPHKDALKIKLEELNGGPVPIVAGDYDLTPAVFKQYQSWLQGLQCKATQQWKNNN